MQEHFAWRKVNVPKQITSKIYETLVSICLKFKENGVFLRAWTRLLLQTAIDMECSTCENNGIQQSHFVRMWMI